LTAFADSSALVKLYADEPGASPVRRRAPFVVSSLARVEVPAALWRKHRIGQLSAQDAGLLAADFAADWHEPAGPFVPVQVGGRVLERAAAMMAGHALRAYDGVQLACAYAAREADPQVDSFLCFDDSLSEAAAREGFQLLT
jgi:predicted nucleic acid-binding protein